MKLSVMNAKIGDQSLLNKAGYIYEPKLDGYRALCYVNKTITLISRNGKDITSNYPELTGMRKNIKAKSCILDGEIVAYDEQGNPSFSLLQRQRTANYIVFDILMKDGELLIDKPLIERKKILEDTVIDGNRIQKILYTNDGVALWHEIKKRHLEGIMAKETEGLYYPGRREKTWLKIKMTNTIDCIIVGYIQGTRIISSLALALYDESKKLRYIGTVGTGFKEQFLIHLFHALEMIKVSVPPVVNPPKNKFIQWVKPTLVGEIKYLEFTRSMILRAPVFLRLRTDKKPQECTFIDQGLPLTYPPNQ
jgi:bifunctional non-homologous end joining protein LigD